MPSGIHKCDFNSAYPMLARTSANSTMYGIGVVFLSISKYRYADNVTSLIAHAATW